MTYVYILLTRSGTAFSQLIRWTTGDAYTHVSLGLGPALRPIYSFARLRARTPLPAGLVQEDGAESYLSLHPDMPCALYRLPVTEAQHAEIARRVARMLRQREKYRYSLLGTALCRLDIAHERGYHYFCSQFVGELLEKSGALRLPKPASLMRPADFAELEALTLVYEGPVGAAGQNAMEGVAHGFPREARAV